ncbi:MAG: Nif3-like dinuclear metal center hexameric protein [Bacteroidales bacterium]|nr:Nif3-like dinuclear metal center hexameric protein [Bacteroidales bacterium]
MEKLSDILGAVEDLAPLSFQDEWDNSGLQVGGFGAKGVLDDEDDAAGPLVKLPGGGYFGGGYTDKVLVCLDVTEDVVDEAVNGRYGLIVSHHPLIFDPLKSLTALTYQERCIAKALKAGISIYSAHTSLDNAPGGVNYKIASLLGIDEPEWLEPSGEDHGSGVVGYLPMPEDAMDFLRRVKSVFKCDSMRYSFSDGSLNDRQVYRVAVCGGAGSFLLPKAVEAGADCFITGDMSYHNFFTEGILVASIGHYESEQFTQELLVDYLSERFPSLTVSKTKVLTNPIRAL